MYQALYRKWRPRTFDEVVGQEHITSILKSQVERGRLSHAYLFTGTRGTGKTTCAKILSRAANCTSPVNGNPCNKCANCLGIENGSILDVLEFDAASNSKVDDIRAVLDETVYTPATAKKRVYIIDEVHMLSNSAFNALLKTLEEPPEHLMFILATTEQHKVPATILSRCQKFAFRRIGAEALQSRITQVAAAEGIDLTEPGAGLIARLADGSLRDALSLLDQCSGCAAKLTEEAVADAVGLPAQSESAGLLSAVASGDAARALEIFDSLYMSGKEAAAILDELLLLCRDLLIIKKAPKSAGAVSAPSVRDTLAALAASASDERLMEIIDGVQSTRRALQLSVNRRVDGELCLAMLCGERRAAQTAPQTAPPSRPAPEKPAAPAAPAPSPAPEQPAPQSAPAAPKPATEQTASKPVSELISAAPQPAAASPAAPAEIPSADWDKILAQSEAKLGIAEFFTLSNAALVRPRFLPDKLIVQVDSEFNLTTLKQPRIIAVLQQAAGMPVEISLPDAGEDGFGQLLRFGRDNPNTVKIY